LDFARAVPVLAYEVCTTINLDSAVKKSDATFSLLDVVDLVDTATPAQHVEVANKEGIPLVEMLRRDRLRHDKDVLGLLWANEKEYVS